jgi:MoaA/NifB/PqqE/SkfB family radical SAM enzyme
MTELVAIEDNDPKKDDILRVEWNLGKRCNYDCSYCGTELHDNHSDYMNWDVYKNTIDKIVTAASGKKIKISFTGGEPFVHPHFIDMLKYAKENGIYRCSVTTNGSPPPKIYEKALPYLHYVVISYHFEFAYHEKVINNITGMWKRIQEYREQDIWKGMHVHIMALPGHLDQWKEIIAELKQSGVEYTIRKIRPRVNRERTGWNPPHAPGTEGFHPKHSEMLKFTQEQPYYSAEEESWLQEQSN